MSVLNVSLKFNSCANKLNNFGKYRQSSSDFDENKSKIGVLNPGIEYRRKKAGIPGFSNVQLSFS
jgi:hypothetical protein